MHLTSFPVVRAGSRTRPAVRPCTCRLRQHIAPCELRARSLRLDHHPYPRLRGHRGPDLRGRAPRAAEPGLHDHGCQRRPRDRAQELPAGGRGACRGRVPRGLRAREHKKRQGQQEHRGFCDRAAGPLRHQEGEQLGQPGRGRDRLALAAVLGQRRRDGEGRERDADRRALLRPLLRAARPLPAGFSTPTRRASPSALAGGPAHPPTPPGAPPAEPVLRAVPSPASRRSK